MILALALPGSAAASSTMTFGFSSASYYFSTPGWSGYFPPIDAATLASGVSANVWRQDVDWQAMQPKSATQAIDFSAIDPMYTEMNNRGVKVVLMVYDAPGWARDPVDNLRCANKQPGDCHQPPGNLHLTDWKNFVQKVVARYPGAAAVEVWNEPNNRVFWDTATGPSDYGRYKRVLQNAYNGVRAVSATMPVLIGGVIPLTNYGVDFDKWLDGVFATGVKGLYNAIGFHPYTWWASPDGGDLAAYRTRMNNVRSKYSDTSPVWITEYGYFTGTAANAVSEYTQGRYLECAYRMVRGWPEYASFQIHTLRDPGTDATNKEDNFGIVRHDLTKKAAYTRLQDMFASGRYSQAVTSCAGIP